jgi:prolyl-tRNA synthetase
MHPISSIIAKIYRKALLSKSLQRSRHFSTSSNAVITPQHVNFAQWYHDVISHADLIDSSPVRGCVILKPRGNFIWDAIRLALDSRLQQRGIQNVYFPLLIPLRMLSKESEHINGFATECAVVTHHRLIANSSGTALIPDPSAALSEPYVIRPTSEAIIWDTFKKWIKTHADLPLRINQWVNVVRWELRTRPFLRSSEFLWQEGHTAHETEVEALVEVDSMVKEYEKLCTETLCVPVIPGKKSKNERFAGADETFTCEAIVQNGWAIQAATSHYLGQSFTRAFQVKFVNSEGISSPVYGTSWGASTRLIGTTILTHSDNIGLVLPSKIAPIQVIIIPIGKSGNVVQNTIIPLGEQLDKLMKDAGIRSKLDKDAVNQTPGSRFYHWERYGTPIRVELGSKDIDLGQLTVKTRVKGSYKITFNPANMDASLIVQEIRRIMSEYDSKLLANAKEMVQKHLMTGEDAKRGLLALLRGTGELVSSPADDTDKSSPVYLLPWHDDSMQESRVKELSKYTLRCFPFDKQELLLLDENKYCFLTGRNATHMALFSRGY